MRSDPTACDVLVVGAGPAGLTAAITLARHGIDVLVVERHDGTSPFPKATGVSTRTMELLRTWGVEQRVRAGAMRVRPGVTVANTLVNRQQTDIPFGYPTDEAALAASVVPSGPRTCSARCAGTPHRRAADRGVVRWPRSARRGWRVGPPLPPW